MTISLRPITIDNWRAVYDLTKTLSAEQQKFVAPNGYSMLEALYDPDQRTRPRAVYADIEGTDTLVGFVMTYYDAEYDEHWIDRLMVAGDYQGKGYGRAALAQTLDYFRTLPECKAVHISFEPENTPARALYASMGFLDTGIVQEGEIVFRLPLRETDPNEQANG
jgi:diamine N-acetyltransferase